MFSAIGVALPIGRYADIHGRGKVFLTKIFVITMASALLTLNLGKQPLSSGNRASLSQRNAGDYGNFQPAWNGRDSLLNWQDSEIVIARAETTWTITLDSLQLVVSFLILSCQTIFLTVKQLSSLEASGISITSAFLLQ